MAETDGAAGHTDVPHVLFRGDLSEDNMETENAAAAAAAAFTASSQLKDAVLGRRRPAGLPWGAAGARGARAAARPSCRSRVVVEGPQNPSRWGPQRL